MYVYLQYFICSKARIVLYLYAKFDAFFWSRVKALVFFRNVFKTDVGIGKTVSERIERLFFQISVCSALHWIIFKIRHSVKVPVECQRKFARRRIFSEKKFCYFLSSSCSGIPCLNDCIGMFIGKAKVHGTSRHYTYYKRNLCFYKGFEELNLRRR